MIAARSGERIYADSSALVKLVAAEAETGALRAAVADATPRLVTSAVARVEVERAVRTHSTESDAQARTQRLLARCELVAVDPLLDAAAALASTRIRTLDAIHLATALAIGTDAVLVYDERLAEAARAHGLRVEQPGRS